MSGGSAKRGAQSKGKEPADEPVDDEQFEFVCLIGAAMWGFIKLLVLAFPERYNSVIEGSGDDASYPTLKEVKHDIQYVSGYDLIAADIDRPATYKQMKMKHDAFGKQHKMPASCITFHGTSFINALSIFDAGFDPALSKRGIWGTGAAYVTPCALNALMYATPDEQDTQWIVFGNSHIGRPDQLIVGREGQRDFGMRADGTQNTTLCDPEMTYFCLSSPEASISNGMMGFCIPTKPSDFALLHMFYRPVVWESMKTRFPGLVEYKKNLVRKRRKSEKAAAWTAEVGTRQQPDRAAKRKLGD